MQPYSSPLELQMRSSRGRLTVEHARCSVKALQGPCATRHAPLAAQAHNDTVEPGVLGADRQLVRRRQPRRRAGQPGRCARRRPRWRARRAPGGWRARSSRRPTRPWRRCWTRRVSSCPPSPATAALPARRGRQRPPCLRAPRHNIQRSPSSPGRSVGALLRASAVPGY